LANPRTNESSIGLKLGLSRASKTDAPLLALQVRPTADETGGKVVQLGKLHLELAFMGSRSKRENIQDKGDAVDDTSAHKLGEISLLTGRELVIEDHQLHPIVEAGCSNLLGLPRAHKECRVGSVSAARHDPDDIGSSRPGELLNFLKIRGAARPELHGHKKRSRPIGEGALV